MATLSNFVRVKFIGTSPLYTKYFAEVDVTETTGKLWWKRTVTKRRQICREALGYWYFVDTGEFAPGLQAEALERAWDAQHEVEQ